MKKLFHLMIIVAVAAVTSCKKDQYYLYNNVARLQFGPEPKRIYTAQYDLADTLKSYIFYYKAPEVTQDTVYFDLYAIGGTKNTDRAFKLAQEQMPNTLNAVAGVHFVPFSDPKVSKFYIIKAGTVHTKVPIILLRDASLKTTTPMLKFKLVDNENFQLGEQNKLWRKIIITDRLSQPATWTKTISQFYLGKYSVVKHSFLIATTGEKWDNDFIANARSVGGLLEYYQAIATTALIDYNNAHPGNPLTDEDGELVVFP